MMCHLRLAYSTLWRCKLGTSALAFLKRNQYSIVQTNICPSVCWGQLSAGQQSGSERSPSLTKTAVLTVSSCIFLHPLYNIDDTTVLLGVVNITTSARMDSVVDTAHEINEIVTAVMSQLPLRDLKSARLVSRTWASLGG